MSLFVAVLGVGGRGALQGRDPRTAGRRRCALQHEVDRRTVLDAAELDRYLPIIEPDFLPFVAVHDVELWSGERFVARLRATTK